MTRRPAVFLDRDGTINREQGFVRGPAQLELLPGVTDALRALRRAGFVLAVCTNQSGIARGLYGQQDLTRVHERMHQELDELPEGYFHCPHHPDQPALPTGYGGACDCRKPAGGLLLRAADILGLDFDRSYLVGDSARDLLAGEGLPLRRILVRSGKPWEEQLDQLRAAGQAPDLVCDDLAAATEWILSTRGERP